MKLGIWRTKDGKEIQIKNMTTQHIKNCIKALKDDKIQVGKTIDIGYTCDGDGDGRIYDFIDCRKEYIEEFENELKRRNDERRRN